jgi:hypothetical protein
MHGAAAPQVVPVKAPVWWAPVGTAILGRMSFQPMGVTPVRLSQRSFGSQCGVSQTDLKHITVL